MAGRPYSERFVGHWAAGPSPVYTVPAGKRAVIKSVVASNNNTAAGVIGIVINGNQVWNLSVPGSGGQTVGGIMLVLYAGETIASEHQFQYMFSAISGFLLDG